MKELAQALMAAQGEMPTLVNNAINPHFRSNYATLDKVIEVARPALSKHGIAVMEKTVGESQPEQCLALFHLESGQSLESWLPLICKDPTNIQQVKSAQTYARRMLWITAAGLAPVDEDDDGAAATGAGQAQGKPSTPTQPQSPDPIKAIYDAIGSHGKECHAYLVSQKAIQPDQKIRDLNQDWQKHILANPSNFVSNARDWAMDQEEIN